MKNLEQNADVIYKYKYLFFLIQRNFDIVLNMCLQDVFIPLSFEKLSFTKKKDRSFFGRSLIKKYRVIITREFSRPFLPIFLHPSYTKW